MKYIQPILVWFLYFWFVGETWKVVWVTNSWPIQNELVRKMGLSAVMWLVQCPVNHICHLHPFALPVPWRSWSTCPYFPEKRSTLSSWWSSMPGRCTCSSLKRRRPMTQMRRQKRGLLLADEKHFGMSIACKKRCETNGHYESHMLPKGSELAWSCFCLSFVLLLAKVGEGSLLMEGQRVMSLDWPGTFVVEFWISQLAE